MLQHVMNKRGLNQQMDHMGHSLKADLMWDVLHRTQQSACGLESVVYKAASVSRSGMKSVDPW